MPIIDNPEACRAFAELGLLQPGMKILMKDAYKANLGGSRHTPAKLDGKWLFVAVDKSGAAYSVRGFDHIVHKVVARVFVTEPRVWPASSPASSSVWILADNVAAIDTDIGSTHQTRAIVPCEQPTNV